MKPVRKVLHDYLSILCKLLIQNVEPTEILSRGCLSMYKSQELKLFLHSKYKFRICISKVHLIQYSLFQLASFMFARLRKFNIPTYNATTKKISIIFPTDI